jgi:hypothetical protein
MSEFNFALMTFRNSLDKLVQGRQSAAVTKQSADGRPAERSARAISSGPEGTRMKQESVKWRIAAAICVAMIYILVTALSGRA